MEENHENAPGGEQEAKHKLSIRTKIAIAVTVIIIIILLLLRACCPSGGAAEFGVIDLPDKATAVRMVNDAVERGMFQVFMNTDIAVDEEGYASLLIQNSEANHYSCYVLIEDDGKEIYRSEVIHPGYKIEWDKLETEIGPGVHHCDAYFCILDESGKEFNRVGLKIKITGGEEHE